MDSGALKRWARSPTAAGLAISTAVGIALGLIGPFGSYLNDGLPVRLAYWVLSLWGGWTIFGLILPWLARRAAGRGVPVWLWAPPVMMALAVPAAVLSRLLAGAIWPVIGGVSRLEWYAQSLVISVIATTAVLWFGWRGRRRSGPDPQSADPRDRLPPRLGRTILCLQMEDHYVRVHTPRGSALVLMSLSQAIAGLKALEGAQTHRSWWVARAAIEGVVEDGRNLRLRLTGGLEAPVSRARVGQLRAEGWLEG
jgi:hypothetical protein